MSYKLLPKSTEEFSDAKFWEGFFKTRGSKAFEWYGEYQDMLDLWAQYAKPGDRVLNIGCGNSELGAELHDRQGCEILCIDTSATVVKQMSRKHCSGGRRPRLSYRVMDAARLDGLDDGGFACAVDKGTLDALMSSAAGESATVDGMLAEVYRVLRVGGRHLIVSLCQRQVVEKLIEHVTLRPWIARVHQVAPAATADPSGFPLPVFFIALTKLRPGSQTMVQALDAYSTGPPERLDAAASLADWIRRAQLTAYSLARPSASSTSAEAGGETRFAYACGRTGLDAFGCHLVSHPMLSRRRSGYAVFIEPIPSGLRTSGSPYGADQRRCLLESQATLRRLLFVRLHPWLYYESDGALQAALSRLVMAFAPRPGMPESEVPFLSTGRLAYPYNTTERSGQFLVEVSKEPNPPDDAAGESSDNDGGELRLVCPDSDLVPLQCRVSSALLTPAQSNAASYKSALDCDCLARFLTAVLSEVGSRQSSTIALVGWPYNLDWVLANHICQGVSLHRHSEISSSPQQQQQQLVDQLAERCCLDYRSAQPLTPSNLRHSLIALFPPAHSQAAYEGALKPEALALLAASLDAGGRLLVATRLFDKKPPALEANANAVAALRACGRFAEVASATFFVGDAEDGEDSAEDNTESDRLRYWIACACCTQESADEAAELLARLPGAVIGRRPPD